MKAEKQARIHQFHDQVALSFDSTEQLYLTAQDAKALGEELIRFARLAETNEGSVATRIVENGKAITESTGKRAIVLLP